MKIIKLESLPQRLKHFSNAQLMFYAEAAIGSLHSEKHVSGVTLKVEGDFKDAFSLQWSRVPKLKGIQEPRELVEFGALAIAFHLVTELTDYEIIEQASIGFGFDYWLGYLPDNPNYDPENFLKMRLEVSGILHGTFFETNYRLKQKIRQLGISDHFKIPGMAIVTEFSQPLSLTFTK